MEKADCTKAEAERMVSNFEETVVQNEFDGNNTDEDVDYAACEIVYYSQSL